MQDKINVQYMSCAYKEVTFCYRFVQKTMFIKTHPIHHHVKYIKYKSSTICNITTKLHQSLAFLTSLLSLLTVVPFFWLKIS